MKSLFLLCAGFWPRFTLGCVLLHYNHPVLALVVFVIMIMNSYGLFEEEEEEEKPFLKWEQEEDVK